MKRKKKAELWEESAFDPERHLRKPLKNHLN